MVVICLYKLSTFSTELSTYKERLSNQKRHIYMHVYLLETLAFECDTVYNIRKRDTNKETIGLTIMMKNMMNSDKGCKI